MLARAKRTSHGTILTKPKESVKNLFGEAVMALCRLKPWWNVKTVGVNKVLNARLLSEIQD